MNPQDKSDLGGWFYAFAAFGWWGVGLPMLLITLHSQAKPFVGTDDNKIFHWNMEILAHRAVWVLAICVVLVTLRKRWSQVQAIFRSRNAVLLLCLSTFFILINWFGFIIGITIGRLNEVAMGYYINPLLNVLLGCWVLGEKLRRFQIVAVVIATLGVGWLVFVHGETPWIAFLLATSFGLYGLIRKKLQFESMVCLTFEVGLCLPMALCYFLYRYSTGPELITLHGDTVINLLLFACGPATAAPLIWFGIAAQRLPLSAIGFIQFLTPTCQFIIALTANNESLSTVKLVGFLLIWTAVGFYLWDAANVEKSHSIESESSES